MGKAEFPMERYFNTFKNEFLNLYNFKIDEMLDKAVYDFLELGINM